ncbi:MAG: VPLPA-CTERM sorting domain-containing protein [Pseudomonadota bacterium]
MKTILSAFMIALGASAAAAATFDDRATFLAQSGSFIEHTDPFSDFTVTTPAGSSINSGFSTFTDKFVPNPYVIVNGVENVDIALSFATSIFAFGMDVFEPQNSTATFNGCNVGTCVESTFQLSFLSGASVVDTITFSPDNEILDFIGYTSAVAFDRIEIRETIGTNDNEFFGNFVTSTTPVSAVPLPAGLPLLLAGMGVFAVLRRRR